MRVQSIHFLSILTVLLIPLPLAVINAFLNPNIPPWNPMVLGEKEVDLEQLLAWEGSYILVDARTPESYQDGHLPEAINLHMGEFDNQVLDLLDRWSPDEAIVVYCDSRQCNASEEIANRLREDFQMDPVFVLKGGWESWAEATVETRTRLGGAE